MKWNELILAVSLLMTLGLQILTRNHRPTNFSVMPIFTPVSLKYEQEMRRLRNQPDSFAPKPMLQQLDYLLATERLTHADSVLIDDLQNNRERMLALRQDRHRLNVEMMALAILLTQTLNSNQWEFVQANRDMLVAESELGTYEIILERLHSIPD